MFETNVYMKTEVTDEQKQQLADLTNAGKYDEVEKLSKQLKQDRHIGKFSYGYRFIFAVNPDLYDVNDMQSLRDFLKKKPQFIIKDDDDIENGKPGKPLTVNEFIEMFNKVQMRSYVSGVSHHHVSKSGISYCDLEGDWY